MTVPTIGQPKRSVRDLALFGGEPLFDRQVHVGRPNIGNRENILRRFGGVLERRWLSNAGPNVRELEERLACMLGVEDVICVCNGTAALEIAIRAAGLSGEVIVPSFTFVATAHALQWQEITPVFCDVDPQTHNLDPARARELITPRTSGIIGVHVWGRACDVPALEDIADRYGLQLMFDAAHALHCTHQGRWIGGFGRAEIFSFHATKFFNTLEGGAVATNDGDLARRIRLMKNFGFTDYDRVVHIGTNGKMNEISAAMGLAGLDEIEDFISINLYNYKTYREYLEVPGISLIEYPGGERHNYQYIVLEVDEAGLGLSRDELLVLLHAENVLARRYFYPGCHRMEPYRSCFPKAGRLLPHTEALCGRVMSLPTGTGIDREGIRAVCALIEFCAERAEEIRRHNVPVGALKRAEYGETGVREIVQ
ncbi:MAG: aminotransferase class I/II-fold pyridoxal phosphate-dependent enzyme [Alphaproteobacteria bacterium]